ncbi:MAG: VWA domain-containing protein [Verrucomicrobiota bacterium]
MLTPFPIPLLPEIQFQAPWFLLLALAAPLVLVMGGRSGTAPAVVFSSLSLLGDIGKPRKNRIGGLGPWLAALGIVATSLALARPQRIDARDHQSTTGIEIQLVIDISGSMSIEDFFLGGQKINRLEAAKQVIQDFVRSRPSDRIGLVIFAGRAYPIGPLTLDHDWLLDRIREDIHFNYNIEQGTAIGSAIASSTERLMERDATSKIVILLTDGAQSVEGLSPMEAAKMASTLGIKFYPIAIGTEGRHFVPRMGGAISQSFDLETLEGVAEVSGGKAFLAKNLSSLQAVFDEIDQLEKSEMTKETIIEAEELFHWPAAVAFGLVCLSLFGRETIFRSSP